MAGNCPTGKCDEIVEHHSTLYDEETGVKTKLNRIEIELERRINRSDVWKAFASCLGLIIILFGLLAIMWKNSEAVPELITKGEKREERITRIEEKFIAFKSDQEHLIRNTEDIKNMLKSIQK